MMNQPCQERTPIGLAFSMACVLIAGACLVPGCLPAWAGQNTPDKAIEAPNAHSTTIEPRDKSLDLAHRDDRYHLCATDVIAVGFPLTPEFNQTIVIQPDGFATLAGVGDVHLQGLTTEQSVQAIRAAYSKVLHDPVVTVELNKFVEPYFIVGGQVRQPGKYDLRGHTTATEAIAIAGGFNHDAKHSQVLLFRRVNDDWFEVKDLNLKRILQGRDLAEDPEIRSGDMLFVPQNMISKVKRLIPAYGVGTYYQLYR